MSQTVIMLGWFKAEAGGARDVKQPDRLGLWPFEELRCPGAACGRSWQAGMPVLPDGYGDAGLALSCTY